MPSDTSAQSDDRTLLQFSRQLADWDGWDGGDTLFDTVTGLHLLRTDLAAVKAASTRLTDRLTKEYARGTRHINYSFELVRREPATKKMARVVRKDDVVDYGGYRLCRRGMGLVGYVTARVPSLGARSELDLPDAYNWAIPRLDRAKSTITRIGRELRESESVLKDRMTAIAELAGWDGRALHLADGAIISTTTERFNSETFRTNEPATWEKLAITPRRRVTTTISIEPIGKFKSGSSSSDEFDEIDGE